VRGAVYPGNRRQAVAGNLKEGKQFLTKQENRRPGPARKAYEGNREEEQERGGGGDRKALAAKRVTPGPEKPIWKAWKAKERKNGVHLTWEKEGRCSQPCGADDRKERQKKRMPLGEKGSINHKGGH